ncbi:MAG TPA: cupin domain-containing protein [Thermoplasmataceae archaeon]|nr:cupin domain-containing protein [Thermoplasmatales archaeon AK]HLH85813.1 cupin domain-containing protein [Thermoplasmataceae archaeon]
MNQMEWGESKKWLQGEDTSSFYRHLLEDAREKPYKDKLKRMVVKPSEMPWELSPQGILKHMVNSEMNTRLETLDIYMQIIPPGSRSGKHRHLAEEFIYVMEGEGYDIHVDCDVEITDTYHWIPEKTEKKFEWEIGDVIYIPPNTIHQHFNGSSEKPARLISAINRIYKFSGLNDLEQIENAPEYKGDRKLTAEDVKSMISRKRL